MNETPQSVKFDTIARIYGELRDKGAKGSVLPLLTFLWRTAYNQGKADQVSQDTQNRTNYDDRSLIR